MTLFAPFACVAGLLLAAPRQEATESVEPHADEFAAVTAKMGVVLGVQLLGVDVEALRSAVADIGALRLREAEAALLSLLARLTRGEPARPERGEIVGEDAAIEALACETFDVVREIGLRFEPDLLAAMWQSSRFRSRERAIADEALDDSDANTVLLGKILVERREWEGWREVADQATRNQYMAARDGKAEWLVAALLPSARSRIVVRDSTRPAKPYVMDEEPPVGLLAAECLELLASWRSREGDVAVESIAEPFVVDAAGLDAAALEAAVAVAREQQVGRWTALREMERDRFDELPIGERIEVVDERGLAPAAADVVPKPSPTSGLAPLPPFRRRVLSQRWDRKMRELRGEWIALARAELGSSELRLAAWGARHAADFKLVELAPEIEAAIASTGRKLAALPPTASPSDRSFAEREALAVGWATLDAAIVLGIEVAPESVEPWWQPRFHCRAAVLLLAARAPDRFVESLLAQRDTRWDLREWPLWCRTVARSGRADTFEKLLDLVEIDIEVGVHVGGRQERQRRWMIGCGSGRVTTPDGFPPPRVWVLNSGSDEGSVQGGDERSIKFSYSTAWALKEADRELLRALGADPEVIAGERARDLDFVDAASFRSARESMVQADAARWRSLLESLVASGRIKSADAERWPSPFRYQERVLGSERSLDDLLRGDDGR